MIPDIRIGGSGSWRERAIIAPFVTCAFLQCSSCSASPSHLDNRFTSLSLQDDILVGGSQRMYPCTSELELYDHSAFKSSRKSSLLIRCLFDASCFECKCQTPRSFSQKTFGRDCFNRVRVFLIIRQQWLRISVPSEVHLRSLL